MRTRSLGLMVVVLLWVAALGGCATGGGGIAPTPTEAPPVIVDPPARPQAATILIAMPASVEFLDVRRSLVGEIQRDYNVSTLVSTPRTTPQDLAAAIAAKSPKCVVLMNNATVNLYHDYQAAAGSKAVFPPAIAVMTSFLDELRPTLANVTGIAYEVPGVTAFVDLRAIAGAPLRRVGVVFRPPFRQFVERQKELAAREQINLLAIGVSKDVDAEELKKALASLVRDSKVDALWMLNDNGLIKSAAFLSDTWRATLSGAKVALIVGVPNLVDPQTPLGTFAVVPDLEGLGLQTANLLFELADEGWKAGDHKIEPPLSVKTIADVKEMRERLGLKDDYLRHVDKALE